MYKPFGKISDLEARKIASEWHGGQGSSLYALCSTGAIDADVASEITECARSCKGRGGSDFTNLIELRTYVTRNGPRGPQDGWSNLHW
jgi:hypothetical protein